MRTSRIRRAVFAGLAALVLSLAPGLSMAADGQGKGKDPGQVGRGAKAWAENCNRCHSLRDPTELQDYEWDVSVNHMRIRAGLPGQVARDIKAFLKASNR